MRSPGGLALAPSTVRETLERFAAAGLTWPLPDEVTDGVLEATLYKNAGTKQGHRRQVEPDWAIDPPGTQAQARHALDPVGRVHRAASRRLPLFPLLRSLSGWEGKLSVTMRQTHVGGEKLFVDYAGDTACR